MKKYVNTDPNMFYCENNPIVFVIIIFWIFSVISHIFTESKIIDIIGENIIITIVAVIAIITLIKSKKSRIQLTSTSMIIHTSSKLIGLKMETTEIPYKHIQIIRVPQVWSRNIFTNTINIKYKGNLETISISNLADMDRFEQEMKNRWIKVNYNMDNEELQEKIKYLNINDADIIEKKYKEFLWDGSVYDKWKRFSCWLWFLPFWFVVLPFIIFIWLFWFSKWWLIDFDFSSVYFLAPLIFIISTFAYIILVRKTSYIKIYPNNILVKKYSRIISVEKYEFYPHEIEYVNIEMKWFTYTVIFKLKSKKEKIEINHINNWEKLNDYCNTVWITTIKNNNIIWNNKLWYNIWAVNQYLESIDTIISSQKNGNKYYCKSSYSFHHKWRLFTLYIFPILTLFTMNHSKKITYCFLAFTMLLVMLFVIYHFIWCSKSFVEFDKNSLKINRPSWFLPKMKVNIVEYKDIDKITITRKYKHPWYDVFVYLKNWYQKGNCVFFNVDDWKKIKNELKWRWIDVPFRS